MAIILMLENFLFNEIISKARNHINNIISFQISQMLMKSNEVDNVFPLSIYAFIATTMTI